MKKNHPIQPLEKDTHGVLRFKENAIVRYILDKGGIDLNHIACQDFTVEDREQFAQLIGYSLSGYGDLSYVREETYATASIMYEKNEMSELEARLEFLRTMIKHLQETLKEPMSILYGKHPDDFENNIV